MSIKNNNNNLCLLCVAHRLNTPDDFSEVELYTPICYCVETTMPCYSFCREWLRNFWERGFGGPSVRDPNFSITTAVAYLKEGK